jgi:exonuclease SbcD
MKFIHAADIHLDSPLIGLSSYEGAPVDRLRGATRRAFEAMVDLAVEETVDFVVIAGDLYDGDWRDFNTGLFFARQAARLGEHGIPVFLLHGNHDAESQITRRLTLPSNVRVFSARRPETCELPGLRVALHGQSFRQREVADNLAAAYPPPKRGWFNIGVLHTALDGREGHAGYAPCDLAGLVRHGYDYWALGHVHRRELLHEHPHVLFPGNLQGRHVRETGAKGCTLVTVEDGRVVGCSHRSLDVLRWCVVEADLGGCTAPGEVSARVRAALDGALAQADGRPLACRLVLAGETPLHGRLLADREQTEADLRALAFDVGVDQIWIEKLHVRTRPSGRQGLLDGRPDAVGALARSLDEVARDPALLAALEGELAELLGRLPHDAADGVGEEGVRSVVELLEEAKELVLGRLLAGEAGP